jgi:protocatechuate 3,4-dioxygenase beta subunit
MDRKEFISTALLSALSVTVQGRCIPGKDGFTADCQTSSDILGPFYRADAPLRQDMLTDALKGSRVEVKGIIYGPDCTSPINDAKIEIWHCNTEGEYDNNSDKFEQRASWITKKDGSYSFKTILPGKYLNGALFRPAHIHFRISHHEHKELISQIYFKGDPHIEKDPWASQKKAELRILPISLVDTTGNLQVTFNIYLEKNNSSPR